jgi:hypothetical protein
MDGAPEPTNDHERAIAEALESKLLTSDHPFESIVTEIVISVPFDMSIADAQFLFNYAHWMAQSAKKQPAHGNLPEDMKRNG